MKNEALLPLKDPFFISDTPAPRLRDLNKKFFVVFKMWSDNSL